MHPPVEREGAVTPSTDLRARTVQHIAPWIPISRIYEAGPASLSSQPYHEVAVAGLRVYSSMHHGACLPVLAACFEC